MPEELGSKSSTGLDENVAGLLCYIAGPISGFIFYLMEKQSRFVRFHAVQAIAAILPLWIAYWVVVAVTGWIPIIGWLVRLVAGLIVGIVVLFMMWRAYNHERFKLPFAGDVAERASAQL